MLLTGNFIVLASWADGTLRRNLDPHWLKFSWFVSILWISQSFIVHMPDATTVSALPPAASNAAGGVVAHSNVETTLHSQPEKPTTDTNKGQSKKSEESHDTSLSYSVDRDAGALRLKVSNQKGETIRELTFTDFVSTMKASSIAKGVLVDDRS